MSCNRSNIADQRFQGESPLQDLGNTLQGALPRLVPLNPSRWLVTVVRYQRDGFLEACYGMRLDVPHVTHKFA
jgi:hypothetical protein